ncbi:MULTISPECIES: hypothetical protein [unclassified Legionella]|uniref:hypothetical protein n=1 Tax=unclassified Legionella TaxID=2622702 RepID=UPI001E6212DB|nr:hypothetical protein [Legionella sp. 31fI33]MCC5014186.1 hypothetical protein [Legionella sp. 31fI33]
MSETIDDLTIAYSEDGTETTRELGKEVLSKGAWTTIMFRYQDWDASKKEFGPIKYSIRRYQKRNNQYWMKSKFNISSEEQARKIIDVLTTWLAENKQ